MTKPDYNNWINANDGLPRDLLNWRKSQRKKNKECKKEQKKKKERKKEQDRITTCFNTLGAGSGIFKRR